MDLIIVWLEAKLVLDSGVGSIPRVPGSGVRVVPNWILSASLGFWGRHEGSFGFRARHFRVWRSSGVVQLGHHIARLRSPQVSQGRRAGSRFTTPQPMQTRNFRQAAQMPSCKLLRTSLHNSQVVSKHCRHFRVRRSSGVVHVGHHMASLAEAAPIACRCSPQLLHGRAAGSSLRLSQVSQPRALPHGLHIPRSSSLTSPHTGQSFLRPSSFFAKALGFFF